MLKFMRISKRMILGVVCSIAGSTLSFFVPLLIKDFIDNKKFDLSLLYVFPFLFAVQFILCAIGGLLISTEADLHVAELRIQAMDIISLNSCHVLCILRRKNVCVERTCCPAQTKQTKV